MRFIRKRNFTVAIIIILTIYAFVDSAIYYYPSYAYKGLDRDFYSSKGYYITYIVGRGLLYGAVLSGFYLLIYWMISGFRKISRLINNN